ncbi:M16 family metallopeptidase [Montanilutibacter psychrotolerans]|uniref:Insulinase family protein n=1 Tax=Montanilutibacter psychrotolerans TaxID=1327343 RepID=A0A3M8SR85_9GAMM|nr:pitrilysin family protein [Lysobacter psychrotolerans]RNF83848.1 insulinase family protein [Lysobacter psychrotolerans]
MLPNRLRPLVLATTLAVLAIPTPPPAAATGADTTAAPDDPQIAAAALPRGVSAGPCVEGVCEYTLGNGLRVLLFPDASRPTVTVSLTYAVGSVHENYGETGMAHLLEHLLFKGTPRHADIRGEMKRRGIGYNASTWLDRTNYHASFPANDDSLAWLLALEADRMVNSRIAKADLDSEMTVVRNEWESRENSPGNVLDERVRATAYLWHNYGNTTIGARSDVENVPIERLQAFYRTWYRPDNASLVIAGRIDAAETLTRIAAAFGTVARPATPMPRAYTVEPTQDGEREVVLRRAGDFQAIVLGYHIPAATHPDGAALDVLSNLLNHAPSGRLHQTLVETRLAAAVNAGNEDNRAPGLMTVFAALPRDGDAARVQAVLLEQIEHFPAANPAEVDAARQRIANSYELAMSNPNGIGMALTDAIAQGDWRLFFLRRDRVAQVSVDDVNRVARTYFKSGNRTLGRYVPGDASQRVEIPPAPSAAAALQGYTGRAAMAAGERFESTPANIDARTQTFTLGTHLKVSLLPKDNRGDTVVVNATFRFGDEASLRGRTDAAVAGALLTAGSATMTRNEITQRFDALKTRASLRGGMQGADIAMISQRDRLADALALAADVMRHPVFPESEFEQLRLRWITSLEASRNEPGSLVGESLGRHFNTWPAGHPLEWVPLDDSLARLRALKVEDLRAFHRDFYGSADGEIAIVGDFDADAVRAQLEALFADWQSPTPYAPIHTRHVDIAATDLRLPAPDKSNAVVKARHNLSLNIDDADYEALMVANQVFGGGRRSRLYDRIRDRDGLSYSIGSAISADASPEGRDDAGSFAIDAIAAPENVDKVERALREELDRLLRDGVTEAEVRDSVAELLTQREQGRASDGSIAGILASNLHYRVTMQYTAERDARYRAMTVEQVNAAIRKHLRPERLSIVAAGDFAKTTPGR